MTQEHVVRVKQPAFSIIIPTLNEEKSIAFFLKQLQGLRENAELILVDGGSTDQTISLAEPWVDQLITTQAGRANQMNKGAEAAHAATLLFLHADSYLPDNALQLIDAGIEQGYRWGRFDVRLLGQHALLPVIAFFMNVRSRLTGIATGDQGIFIAKDLFNRVDGYPQIALMEDIALSKAVKRVAKPYCISQKLGTSARRWLQFGLIKTILLMWWLRLQYFFGVKPNKLAELYGEGRFWKH